MSTNPSDTAHSERGVSTGNEESVRTIAFASDGVGDSNRGLDRTERFQGLAPEPEHAFDRIAELAAHLFDTPAALISLLDDERLWFKSAVGVKGNECALNESFCARVIDTGKPLVVLDTNADAAFRNGSIVSSDPPVRFYAGAPLLADDNAPIGSICVLDTVPREEPVSEKKMEHLEYLSEIVMDELDLRHVIQKGEVREQELRDARNNAESANQAMSQFFAGITHDLRTPLTRILLFNDLLERTQEPTDDASAGSSYTEKIRAAGTRMNMLITSLLELAELRSGRFELDLQTVNVSEVVTDACEGVEMLSESDTTRLQIVSPQRPLYAQADSNALTRVLDNLIENAIKHTDPSDSVVVTLRYPHASSAAVSPDETKEVGTELGLPSLTHLPPRGPTVDGREHLYLDEETVLVEIIDNGPGIAPDLLETLFDPYTQGPKRAASDDNASSSGVGLGLAITSDLVRAMDGAIHVHTEVGTGTCFHIHLPAVAMD